MVDIRTPTAIFVGFFVGMRGECRVFENGREVRSGQAGAESVRAKIT